MTARKNGGHCDVSVVLGVHDGHNASAALLRDGRIELALQEERLTRVKNQGDAPGGAVRAALALANAALFRQRPPVVALNGHYMNYRQWQRETILRDYARCSSLGSRLKQSFKTSAVDRAYQRRRAAERAGHLGAIGLSGGQLAPVEHHQAHAAAAYYTSPWGTDRRKSPGAHLRRLGRPVVGHGEHGRKRPDSRGWPR